MRYAIILTAGLSLCLGAVARSAEPMKATPAVPVAAQPSDNRAQLLPACAFAPSTGSGQADGVYLVVWQQGLKYYEKPDAKIWAARVSAEGKALDAKPIEVCAAVGCQERPGVAFSKGVFLVVWQDFRNGKDWDVYAGRVTPDGKALDKDGIAVASSPATEALPQMAPGPDGFLVAWQSRAEKQYYRLSATRVSAEGRVLDPDGKLEFQGKPIEGGSVALTRAGKGWFAFWKRPVYGQTGCGAARIEEQGGKLVVAEAPGRMPDTSDFSGRSAADGKGSVLYVGATVGGRGAENRPAVGLLLAETGCSALKNPNEHKSKRADYVIPFHPDNPGIDAPVAVAGTDGLFLLAAKGAAIRTPPVEPYCNQIHAARVGSDGKLIDPADKWQVLDDGAERCSSPALAAGRDGKFLLVYQVDGGPGKQRVVARIVTAK